MAVVGRCVMMAEPAGGWLPPALLCVFGPGQTGCHVFPEALLRIPLKPSSVVFKMTDQIRQTASAPTTTTTTAPPTCTTRKSGFNYYCTPRGTSKIPPFLICQKWSSCFLWLAEICLLILNHTGFHWLHDQDKCLSYLFMSLEMTLQLSNAETWLQTPMLCWLWVRESPK